MNFKKLQIFVLAGAVSVGVVSCKKSESTSDQSNLVSKEVLSNISKLGFSTENVIARDGGYLVEGDILLTNENFTSQSQSPNLRIAQDEQYRTTNLVNALPRVITVSVTNLTTAFSQAADLAISRYNAQNLRITFQRVASGGNIDIVGFNEAASGGYITLGSAGFPTSSGDPFNQIKMNTNVQAYGSNPDVNYVASVLTHEIGHCIGFRHTDYMARQYSCGGKRKVNEGTAGVGAILIPGTPSTPDAESWMLACSNGGNRLFNANDVIALNYLY
ncbi:M57 family metalloprotease [Daejeonella oryzae]|uniref:M57 family metalloprotease n=1 Tax=Daejeonella oryzae TaxID=1122943 RepID=UPI000410B9C4|nr:M57 family metalloprotease [Daejeonella oryzae]